MICGCGGGSGGGSPDVEIPEQTTLEEYQEIDQGLDDAAAKYDELAEVKSPEDARSDLVVWLQTQPHVSDAGLGDDQYSVWIHYDSGIGAVLLTETPALPSPLDMKGALRLADSASKASVQPRQMQTTKALSLGKPIWLWGFGPFYWEQVNECLSNGDGDACYAPETSPYHDYTKLQDLKHYYVDPNLQQPFYAVPSYNSSASVDMLLSVINPPSFGAQHLFISTHGGITKNRQDQSVGFAIMGEPLTWENYQAHRSDLAEERLIVVHHRSEHYFAFTPAFIRYYYENNDGLGMRHVFLAACFSYHPSMVSAFMESGAISYAGFSGLVSHDFSRQSCLEFFANMAAGLTAKEAYDQMSQTEDLTNNPGTFLRISTQSDESGYFHRMFFEFGGNHYETPSAELMTAYNHDDGVIMNGLVVAARADANLSSPQPLMGQIAITIPAAAGTYDLSQPGTTASITFVESATGIGWTANRQCIEEDPLCLCSGTFEIEEFSDTSGGFIKGTVDAVLVDSNNVTTTAPISLSFTALRSK